MAEKATKLSIVIRTVDKATAKIKAINDRLEKITKPIGDFKEALGELRETSGLDDVIGGFKGVGSAVVGVLSKLAMIGGVVVGAGLALKSLIDEFSTLGDVAQRFGSTVDFVAQLRYVAARSGASAEQLDKALDALGKNMGELRVKGGAMAKFLGAVSPALLRQVKATKSNEEAFLLLADAMTKIKDPAKRAIFATKTLGDAALAQTLGRGSKGIQELRDRYAEFNPEVGSAVAAAGEAGDAFHDLNAATDGIKAALVTGLAPALKVIVEQLRDFLKENRTAIAEWAASIGKKLPGAVKKLVGIFGGVVDAIKPFVDSGTKLKVLAVALAGVIVGPLISAVVSLGIALLTTPVGWIVTGLAAIGAAVYLLVDNWDAVVGFFRGVWDGIKSAFATGFGWIKTVFLNYTPLGLIIKHWGPIKDFFVGIWGGITGVFEKAWEIIKGIVGHIVDAIEWVARKVKEFYTGTAEGRAATLEAWGLTPEQRELIIKRASGPATDVAAQSARAIGAGAGAGSSEARVTIDIANAPRGTRVTTDPQSTADVDMTVGYQMGFAP
ncbi:MAG: hypothetical protein ACTHU0_08365 [Kofleriaceae bacterium]